VGGVLESNQLVLPRLVVWMLPAESKYWVMIA